MINPYRILGVAPDASFEEIRSAYLRIAKATHPDRNRDPEAQGRFIEAHQAFTLLRQQARRRGRIRGAPGISRRPAADAAPRSPMAETPDAARNASRDLLTLRRDAASLNAGVVPPGYEAVRPSLANLLTPFLFPAALLLLALYLHAGSRAPGKQHSYLVGAIAFALLSAALIALRSRFILRSLCGRQAVWIGPAGIHIVSGRAIESLCYGDIRTLQFGFEPAGRLGFHPHFIELVIGEEGRPMRIEQPYGEERLRRIVDLMLLFS